MSVHHNDSVNIPFLGGILLSFLNAFKQLFDQHTFMIQDFFNALALGIVGAIGSGIGTLLWKYATKKRLKP